MSFSNMSEFDCLCKYLSDSNIFLDVPSLCSLFAAVIMQTSPLCDQSRLFLFVFKHIFLSSLLFGKDNCNLIKIPVHHQFVKHSDLHPVCHRRAPSSTPLKPSLATILIKRNFLFLSAINWVVRS